MKSNQVGMQPGDAVIERWTGSCERRAFCLVVNRVCSETVTDRAGKIFYFDRKDTWKNADDTVVHEGVGKAVA